MKEILIINGSGGVGKDTFVGCLSQIAKVYHTSIVNPVKGIAKQVGWDGGKTETDRKFLSDLKVLVDNYNDYNYKEMKHIMRQFLLMEPCQEDKIRGAEILCIDMRERFQIERAQKEFGAKTILVTRKSVPRICSNIADAGVFDIEYDYHIRNDGTKQDLLDAAKALVALLHSDRVSLWIKYISEVRAK